MVNQSEVQLRELVVVVSDSASYRHSKSEFTVEGFRLTKFRDWVAVTAQVPSFVARKYIVPRLLRLLLSEGHFGVLRKESNYIFVNKEARMSSRKWERVAAEIHAAARENCERWKHNNSYRYIRGSEEKECIEEYTRYHIKERFSYTEDTSDQLAITDEEMTTLGS